MIEIRLSTAFFIMKNLIRLIFSFSLIIGLISCERTLYSDSETVLARVGEKYLHISDISDNMSLSGNESDSIRMIKSMVDNWVRQELLLQRANTNLPDSLKDFSKQLESYKNNLIVYEYKKRLVAQNLDTKVSDSDIESYYASHQKEFELKENIIQFVYMKIPIQSEFVEEAKHLINTIADTTIDRIEVENFCLHHAVDYFLDHDQWVPFNDLLKMIPIEAYNQEIYLKNNKMISIKNHPYWYFINIRNFKIKEDVSPLNFERNKIENIILNKRKLQLLNNLDESIFQEASLQHQFEIY